MNPRKTDKRRTKGRHHADTIGQPNRKHQRVELEATELPSQMSVLPQHSVEFTFESGPISNNFYVRFAIREFIEERLMFNINGGKERYKYYFLTKPYSLQPYPSGYKPADIVYFDIPKTIKGYNTMVYGYIIFDNKLDGWDCLKYDLWDFN